MEKQNLHTCSFYIGDWYVEPEFNKLSYQENIIQLQPKMMDVLVCLAASAGTPVSYDMLIWEVWEDLDVRDNVLHRTISHLRKTLATNASEATYIKTIPKNGYCLVAPVRLDSEVPATPIAPSSPIDRAPVPSGQETRHARATTKQAGSHAPWLFSISIFSVFLLLTFQLLPSEEAASITALPRLFTSTSGMEVHPSFSPDGDQLAYVWLDPEGGADIYLQDIDNESPRRITTSKRFEYHPVWSSDGQSLAYYSFDRGVLTDCWIMVHALADGTTRLAAPCDKSMQRKLAWSNDGKWIAYEQLDRASDTWRVHLRSLSSGEAYPVSTPDDIPFDDSNFAFSSDSRQLLFYRYDPTSSESRGDLFVTAVGASSNPVKKVTDNFGYIYDFSWAHTSDELYFFSLRDEKRGLWHMNMDEYDPQLITTIPEIMGSLSVSPSGERLAYVSWNYEENLWQSAMPTADNQTPAKKVIIESTRRDVAPQYSPDGSQLAFTSNRTGFYELWISDADGQNQRKLTSLNTMVRAPRWSPDGKQIAIHALQDGQVNIFTIDVASGMLDQITANGADDMLPAWSVDGNTIFFSSARTGDYEIWQIELKTRQAQQLTAEGGLSSFEAADAQSLYFSKNGENGIWQLDYQTGMSKQLTCNLDHNDYRSWVPGQDGIYYLMRAGGGASSRLMRYDFTKGESVPLMPVNPALFQGEDGLGLTISPDQQWIVYGRVDEQSSDIMLIDTE